MGFKNINIKPNNIKPTNKTSFNIRQVGGKYLLVNEWGDYVFLSEGDLEKFYTGKLHENKEPFLTLSKRNFIKSDLNQEYLADRYARKKGFLFGGPNLHIVVVTMRCNLNCVYCHASARGAEEKSYDMDIKTADKVLDMIFAANNDHIAIEFQGGEPLLNWPVVAHIVKESRARNKSAKKNLELRLVTNGSMLDDERFRYLIDNNVAFCISYDGPEKLHNKNRVHVEGNNYRTVVKWIKRLNDLYPELAERGYIWKVGTSPTITRFSFSYWKEMVDEHLELGFDRMYLRPLNPFGFSQDKWNKIGYTSEEFLAFYRRIMDYIIDTNLRGEQFIERFSATFLIKVLSDLDPNHLDFRSPCGAGIGQLAYHYNGDVYTCDEGRMLAMMDDHSFRLGNVFKDTYEDIVTSPMTKSLCIASCLEALPGCEQCVYRSYCGVCPIYNYFEQGDIFVQMTNNDRCRLSLGIMDYLFVKMQDDRIKKIFEQWVGCFVHPPR